MKTTQVSIVRALELTALMSRASSNAPVGEGFFALRHKPGVLLVDAVNCDPFIFVAPDTVHTFESKPGSGTDHRRQRMLAGQFFESFEPFNAGKLDDPLRVQQALLSIKMILEEADSVFSTLSRSDQDVLTNFHHADGSISLSLRRAATATDELLEALRPARTLDNQSPSFEP